MGEGAVNLVLEHQRQMQMPKILKITKKKGKHTQSDILDESSHGNISQTTRFPAQ